MADKDNKNPDAAADDAAKAALGQKGKKEAAPEGEAEAAEGGGEEGAKKSSKMMLFIIIGAVVLLLGIGGGAAFFLLGSKGDAAHEEEHAAEEIPQSYYFTVPEMTVNLDGGGSIVRYLQLNLVLEVDSEEAVQRLEADLQTPLLDEYQTYLRTLRVEDLQGSAGLYKLRETLLFRTNQITAPIQVKRVLFKNILVQ